MVKDEPNIRWYTQARVDELVKEKQEEVLGTLLGAIDETIDYLRTDSDIIDRAIANALDILADRLSKVVGDD